jgi:hypothetical protein
MMCACGGISGQFHEPHVGFDGANETEPKLDFDYRRSADDAGGLLIEDEIA